MSNSRQHFGFLFMRSIFKVLVVAVLLAAPFVIVSFSARAAVAPVGSVEAFENDRYELILQVGRHERVLTKAFMAFQGGLSDFYIPVSDLLRLLELDVKVDITAGRVEGMIFSSEDEFSIDVKAGVYTVAGVSFALAPGDAFVKEYAPGYGDIYVRLERLNEIIPLELAVNLLTLTLSVDTTHKLPYELRKTREEKHNEFLERANGEIVDYSGYAHIANPYLMYSPPVLDVSADTYWESEEGAYRGRMRLSGRNDLLGFSANYNLTTDYDNEEGLDLPDDLRMTMTRQAFGDDVMPLGVRRLSVGDVSARTSDLIQGSNSGRGVTISSRPIKRSQTFDEITVEGTAMPGWEVEVYRNDELIDFGVVSDTGEYRFDDIAITAGTNKIRTVLYGPQGQVEEYFKDYKIAGNLLSPGTVEYEAALVDTTDNLISFDGEKNTRRGEKGLVYSAGVRRGLSRNLTVFGTASNSSTYNEQSKYVTAGANFSLGPVVGTVEGYKQIDGGMALDTRLSSRVAGWNLNLRTALLSDFESNRIGFGESAKTSDTILRVGRRFPLPVGQANVQFLGKHFVRENDTSQSQLKMVNTFSRFGQRFGHSLLGLWQNRELSSVQGRLDGSMSLNKKWDIRAALDYDLRPEFALDDLSADLRYRPSRKLSTGANISRDLQNDTSRVGTNVNYDFGSFLGTLNTQWRENGGYDVSLRASTSLAPFGKDGAYIADSRSMRAKNVVHGHLFIDKDFDNIYGPGDVPLEGAKLSVNNRKTKKTDEDGDIDSIRTERNEFAALSFDQESANNPFLIATEEGYRVLLRAAVSQNIDIPIVESGVIDGTAFFENGNPVPGLRLHLVDHSGEIVAQTMTSFDGFYTFELVRPGIYKIQADPSSGIEMAMQVVKVSPDDLFVYESDLGIKEPEDLQTARRVEKLAALSSPARQEKYSSILGKLKKMQQALNAR